MIERIPIYYIVLRTFSTRHTSPNRCFNT